MQILKMKHQNLTGQQIQWLIDRFNLSINLDDGVVVASRKDGRELKAETIAKMVGIKETPANWREAKVGEVRGL